ncbi:MAG: glycosyltransferase family 4 protein [Terracidiphilus sp.]
MTTAFQSVPPLANDSDAKESEVSASACNAAVALLTGGIDRPYAYGLSLALALKGVKLDVIGNGELESPEIHAQPTVTFLALHGDLRQAASLPKRLLQHLKVYGRIIRYAATAKPRIFHILWNYKFQLFDRTILILYYKILGKRIVLTAHNVNAAARDGNESMANRLSLKFQYRLSDHIFVHTDKMKAALHSDFGVREKAVTVIPFGLNNSVPDTELTPVEAKRKLGIDSQDKVVLFFGRMRPYKGLDYLVEAFQQIVLRDNGYRLVIAGEPKKDSERHWREIQESIERKEIGNRVIQEARFIRDDETEIYFKAADVLVLPYSQVFQSGVLFLAYSFGLPVIATDVGSLRDDIVEGRTGYVCQPCDATDLAKTIERYFASDLFMTLERRRVEIKAFAGMRNSWGLVGEKTCEIYAQLLAQSR